MVGPTLQCTVTGRLAHHSPITRLDLTLAVRPGEGFPSAECDLAWATCRDMDMAIVIRLSMGATGTFRTESASVSLSTTSALQPSQNYRVTWPRPRSQSTAQWLVTALSPHRGNSQPGMMPRRAKMCRSNPGLQEAVVRHSRIHEGVGYIYVHRDSLRSTGMSQWPRIAGCRDRW